MKAKVAGSQRLRIYWSLNLPFIEIWDNLRKMEKLYNMNPNILLVRIYLDTVWTHHHTYDHDSMTASNPNIVDYLRAVAKAVSSAATPQLPISFTRAGQYWIMWVLVIIITHGYRRLLLHDVIIQNVRESGSSSQHPPPYNTTRNYLQDLICSGSNFDIIQVCLTLGWSSVVFAFCSLIDKK